MAMDGLPEGVSPSGRVPEQLLQAASILKRRGRRNREGFAKKGSVLGVSTPRGKYRRRGRRGAPRGRQEGARRGPGWGRATSPPGCLVLPPCYLDDSGRFRHDNFYYSFVGFFWVLYLAGKPEKQKQQKTGTGS